jgi:phosphate:Na+ symporter
MQTAREHPELRILADQLTSAISFSVADPYELETANHKLKRLYRHIDSEIEPFRQRVINQTSDEAYSIEAAFAELDAIRWLRRVTYHAWRITYHLQPQSAKQTDYDDDRVIDDEN